MAIGDIYRRYRNGNAWKWDELLRTKAYVEQVIPLARFNLAVLNHIKLDPSCDWIAWRGAFLTEVGLPPGWASSWHDDRGWSGQPSAN